MLQVDDRDRFVTFWRFELHDGRALRVQAQDRIVGRLGGHEGPGGCGFNETDRDPAQSNISIVELYNYEIHPF